jgi:heme oxygenase
LAYALRERTREVHRRAELSELVQDILCGRITRRRYALMLHNLLPVYQELERALDDRRQRPVFACLAKPEIFRSAALKVDLDGLVGLNWEGRLPILSAARDYADRIGHAAREPGARLVAHAYTRFLGDLNGGAILARALERSLGLGSQCLTFYAFPQVADVQGYICDVRDAIDEVGRALLDWEAVLAEAETAFRLNIALFEQLQAYP